MSEIKAGVDYPKPRATVAGTILSVCLLAGYVAQRDKIDFRMVGRARRELEGQIDL